MQITHFGHSCLLVELDGTRILFDGEGYEARWWTKGDSPAAAEADAAASPWRPLSGDGSSASPGTP